MAKSRRRRSRKRSEASKVVDHYRNRFIRRVIDDGLEDAEKKEKQNEYMAEIAKLEQDLLSRTVLVKKVKDASAVTNQQNLRAFMEQKFGRVEDLQLHYFRIRGNRRGQKNFPAVRVRFQQVRDAEKIFGMPLKQAGHPKVTHIEAPGIGYGNRGDTGFLEFQPSKQYAGMLEEQSLSKLQLSLVELAIGHWFPIDQDAYLAAADGEQDEFVQAASTFRPSSVIFDLNDRTISVDLNSYRLVFRFKAIKGQIDFFADKNDTYSLVLGLKYPPKLFSVSVNAYGNEETSREINMPGIFPRDVFERTRGIKMSFTRVQAALHVFNKPAAQKLVHFGVLGPIDSQIKHRINIVGELPNVQQCFDMRLLQIKMPDIYLRLRQMIDAGITCSHYALKDRCAGMGCKDIFEIASMHSQSLSLQVALDDVNTSVWPTRFPAKFLNSFFEGIDKTEDFAGDSIPSYCMEIPRVMLTPTRTSVVGTYIEMSNRVVRHFVNSEGFEPSSFLRVSVSDEDCSRMFQDDLGIPVCDRIKKVFMKGLQLNGRHYEFLAYSSSQLKEQSIWMVCTDEMTWTVESIRQWMGDFSQCKTASKFAARMGQCFSTSVATNIKSGDSTVENRLNTNDNFPDILSAVKDTPHSDGTGLIQRPLLRKLVMQFPSCPSDPDEVSIIQVRYGGAKGTLTGWDFDHLKCTRNVRNTEILLRPSMVKFAADYKHLEVITIGKQIPYYLNRHVILLLGAHNVPDSIFLDMQRQMLEDLDLMLHNSQKAIDLVPRLSGPDSSVSAMLVHMMCMGLDPKVDPFLLSCLHAIWAHHLMNLRKKSRIFVSEGAVLLGGIDETGLLPEGCVFVKVRVDDSKTQGNANRDIKRRALAPLVGPVMVTKHPVMHPGDVRMLLAIDIPELHSQKNLILFSQHGQRPEPHKMAGSDLDGDQFAVTWDNRLFLNKLDGHPSTSRRDTNLTRQTLNCMNVTPMSYDDIDMDLDISSLDKPRRPNDASQQQDWSETLGRGKGISRRSSHINRSQRLLIGEAIEGMMSNQFPCKTSQSPPQELPLKSCNNLLADHFINFAKNDNLGRIANMWLDYAAKDGADCEKCMKLARLASIAVDFPKSGVPAEISRDLKIPHGTPRPHWREVNKKHSYQCKSVVGLLYNEIKQRQRNHKELINGLISLAGRVVDNYGQISCFLRKDLDKSEPLMSTYNGLIAERLGWSVTKNQDEGRADEKLIHLASEERFHYEERLMSLMSKYKLHSEGELVTGCIRKFHRLHKRRQHDLSEEIRRQSRELRKEYRMQFFLHVLHLTCPDASTEVDEEDAYIIIVERLLLGKTVGTYSTEDTDDHTVHKFNPDQVAILKQRASKLAAAYYVVTYNIHFRRDRKGDSCVLFNFPWIVADVIAHAVSETTS